MDVITVIKRSPVVFPLACIAAVALIFISEGSYWQSVSGLQDLARGRDAREHILGLERSLLDAETGQRGYLLTQNKDYLVPYEKALADTETSFKALEAHYQDAPEESAVLSKLHTVTGAKLSELALTIRLQNGGRSEAVIDLVRSNIGKEQMEEVRVLSSKLLTLSSKSVVVSRVALYRTLMLSRTGMAMLAALSLLSLYLYLRHANLHDQHQRELQRLIQAERDGLATEVALRTTELSELTAHLLTAREDERARLARDLHDELGALLTSAKLDAARIRSRLAGTAPAALERLAHLVESLNGSIALGRRIIEGLRPSALSNLGLVTTLEILAREFTEQSGIEVSCTLSAVQLSPSTALVVYRVVQEAITNISKYAHAKQVWLDMDQVGNSVHLAVRDDGVGFDGARRRSSTFGLVGMRFRIEAEGGTLTLTSAPGQGTRLQVTLPSATPAKTAG
jgi:signal transduction histidine kinase